MSLSLVNNSVMPLRKSVTLFECTVTLQLWLQFILVYVKWKCLSKDIGYTTVNRWWWETVFRWFWKLIINLKTLAVCTANWLTTYVCVCVYCGQLPTQAFNNTFQYTFNVLTLSSILRVQIRAIETFLALSKSEAFINKVWKPVEKTLVQPCRSSFA